MQGQGLEVGKKYIDYKTLVVWQLNDTRQAISCASDEDEVSLAEDYLKVFGAMLGIDEEATAAEALLNEETNQRLALLTIKQQKDSSYRLKKAYIIELFKIYMSLARRKGYAIIQDAELEV